MRYNQVSTFPIWIMYPVVSKAKKSIRSMSVTLVLILLMLRIILLISLSHKRETYGKKKPKELIKHWKIRKPELNLKGKNRRKQLRNNLMEVLLVKSAPLFIDRNCSTESITGCSIIRKKGNNTMVAQSRNQACNNNNLCMLQVHRDLMVRR